MDPAKQLDLLIEHHDFLKELRRSKRVRMIDIRYKFKCSDVKILHFNNIDYMSDTASASQVIEAIYRKEGISPEQTVLRIEEGLDSSGRATPSEVLVVSRCPNPRTESRRSGTVMGKPSGVSKKRGLPLAVHTAPSAQGLAESAVPAVCEPPAEKASSWQQALVRALESGA